ncbi:macro domain-containing protein [Aeromonas caviae]|uniref:macro domain-containing protein n=1 Tax=Aeromonas caviae TaxID=648 RepID=UPI00244CB03A|nr:macro domain-containing protein [Aeromonas caviae]MDH0137715.1 macro domain-containing protein [Aeromonas caviae]
MIKFIHGNLFDSQAKVIVNAVNTVGVMGKGIALDFKEKFPSNMAAYKQACTDGIVQIGKVFPVRVTESKSVEWVVNFPTKKHWKGKSDIEWIKAGLVDLKKFIESHNVASIAIPPLGAGHGGLPWNEVKTCIVSELSSLIDVDIELYEPLVKKNNDPVLYVSTICSVLAEKMHLANGIPLSFRELDLCFYIWRKFTNCKVDIDGEYFEYSGGLNIPSYLVDVAMRGKIIINDDDYIRPMLTSSLIFKLDRKIELLSKSDLSAIEKLFLFLFPFQSISGLSFIASMLAALEAKKISKKTIAVDKIPSIVNKIYPLVYMLPSDDEQLHKAKVRDALTRLGLLFR